MTQILEIVVSPTGTTRLETKGFAGTSCREASQFLEAALGARESEVRTAEFYRSTFEQAGQAQIAQRS